MLCGIIISLTSCAAALCAEELLLNDRAKEMIDLVKKMPEWPFSPGIPDAEDQARAEAEAREVENVAATIAQHELDDIRAAMKQLALRHDAKIDAKLFILNQYLFDIPEKVKYGSIEDRLTRHSYFGLPPSVMTSKIWPWELENGQVRFGTKGLGYMYMGPPYEAVETFDQFRKHFGRRSIKRDKKDK